MCDPEKTYVKCYIEWTQAVHPRESNRAMQKQTNLECLAK